MAITSADSSTASTMEGWSQARTAASCVSDSSIHRARSGPVPHGIQVLKKNAHQRPRAGLHLDGRLGERPCEVQIGSGPPLLRGERSWKAGQHGLLIAAGLAIVGVFVSAPMIGFAVAVFTTVSVIVGTACYLDSTFDDGCA